jgi:acyl-CoA reductase-like NAD-dependent aldehyde dehydrogenase
MEQRQPIFVPLIIDGDECMPKSSERIFGTEGYRKHSSQHYDVTVYGADVKLCHSAVNSCTCASDSWKGVNPHQRRELFFRLANHLRERGTEIKAIMEEEIKCTSQWSHIDLEDAILLIKETASLIAPTMSRVIPHTESSDSQALILTEPLGVILGIAPWNSLLILGLRAVVAPIAAANTAILKDPELPPRTYHFIACLFQEVGFPPGVLNFLLHKGQDAPEIF